MNKTIINVPSGIKYIGDWEEFNNIFPMHPHIMNKILTGCGFTEWCLRNNMNVILCSPRNILLDNKARQHEGEVYRFRSQYFDKDPNVDKSLVERIVPKRRPSISQQILNDRRRIENERLDKEEKEADIINSYQRLKIDLTTYFSERQGKAKKILVTYDSFHLVRDVLEKWGLLRDYYIIVDEFTSIFTDSRFKATVEMDFVEQLRGLDKVCYLSATPMMEAYLNELDEFKDLPYYQLDWSAEDPTRIVKPDLIVRTVSSIFKPAKRIIGEYKSGEFKKSFIKNEETGEIEVKESKEVVFYVNSVNNIQEIVKKCDLKPEEVNIICANNDKNRKFLREKLGKDYEIGQFPLKTDPHKMFTFCTRTAYLGADFYSDNARTIILSDANIESLAVDISLDLPQIMGRQRMIENPWKNSAEFYFKQLTPRNVKMSREDFEKTTQEKVEMTNNLLQTWNRTPEYTKEREAITEVYGDRAKLMNYEKDFVAISKRSGAYPIPVLNKLVLVSERRAYDIQALDYKDRVSVINTAYKAIRGDEEKVLTSQKEATLIFDQLDSLKTVRDKLKFLCNVLNDNKISDEAKEIVKNDLSVKFKGYLSLGFDRLRALNYRTTLINKEISKTSFDRSILAEVIYQNFQIGESYSNQEIKQKLKEIYRNIGYDGTAKANDILEWFKVKNWSKMINGKKVVMITLLEKV